MDGKGQALDNIFIERYWKSSKYESVFLHNYFSVSDAKIKTAQYVEFYNSRRFHSSLNYKTHDGIYFKNLPKEVQEFKQCLKKMSYYLGILYLCPIKCPLIVQFYQFTSNPQKRHNSVTSCILAI